MTTTIGCTLSAVHVRVAVGVFMFLAIVTASNGQGRHAHRHKAARYIKSVSAHEARAAAVRKEMLRRRLSGVHSHMHQVRARIHKARVQEKQLSETIDTVQARIARTRATLRHVNSRINQLDRTHAAITVRLADTRARLAARRMLLGERIRSNYERCHASYAQVLIQSRSVHELLSRGYYVRQIVHSDAELVQGVQQDVRQIDADRRTLEAQERRQRALDTQFEAEKSQYIADLAEQNDMLQGTQDVREQAESELDDLEAEANAMTDNIRELSDMLQRRRDAERAANRSHSSPGHHNVAASEIAPVWHGGFIRPCAGRVTSGFGSRYHPILHRIKMHTGIDFGAPYGAPIVAAGGGTVILAHYTNGYGNCVVIDHGDGVTTLYGHCSALLVSVDEVVRQGQQIARVGATGMATGPHLHFEVRRNGVPVNPR